MTLIACSMDGQIVGINFGSGDLGQVMSANEKGRLFKNLYGKTTGKMGKYRCLDSCMFQCGYILEV